MIRGKGSVKELKVISGKTQAAFEEPLHALVSAPNDEVLKKAVAMVTTIVKTAVENPEGEADLRKLQIMELAKMNGTLREGAFSGMAWLKEEGQHVVNTTVCTTCGGRGHLATDCKMARPGTTHNMRRTGKETVENKLHMDSEYQALMSELGQTTSAPVQLAQPQIGTGTSQMATHSIGGAAVQAAIEDKPQPGAPMNDYGYGAPGAPGVGGNAIEGPKPLKKEDMVNRDMLGNGMWDNAAMGMTTDYTIGAEDQKSKFADEDKAMMMMQDDRGRSSKRRKTYGQADPDAVLAITGSDNSYQSAQNAHNQKSAVRVSSHLPNSHTHGSKGRANIAVYQDYQGMSITGKSHSSKIAYSHGGYSTQGHVDYDPRRDATLQQGPQGPSRQGPPGGPGPHGPSRPGAPGGHVQYKNFPQHNPNQHQSNNRQVKMGLGYQAQHPDANPKERISIRNNNYARQTLGPNMGFVGPQDPSLAGNRRPPQQQNGYKKPTAAESCKRHFNGGY